MQISDYDQQVVRHTSAGGTCVNSAKELSAFRRTSLKAWVNNDPIVLIALFIVKPTMQTWKI